MDEGCDQEVKAAEKSLLHAHMEDHLLVNDSQNRLF